MADGIGGDMLEEFRLAYVAHRADDVGASPETSWGWLANGYRLLLGDPTLYNFHSGSARQIWDNNAHDNVRNGARFHAVPSAGKTCYVIGAGTGRVT